MLKKINIFFALVYSVVLLVAVYYVPEFVFLSYYGVTFRFLMAAVFIVALCYSVYLHLKLRNRTRTDAYIFCLVVTAINVIILLCFIAVNNLCRGDVCFPFALAAPFVVGVQFILWGIGLLRGSRVAFAKELKIGQSSVNYPPNQ